MSPATDATNRPLGACRSHWTRCADVTGRACLTGATGGYGAFCTARSRYAFPARGATNAGRSIRTDERRALSACVSGCPLRASRTGRTRRADIPSSARTLRAHRSNLTRGACGTHRTGDAAATGHYGALRTHRSSRTLRSHGTGWALGAGSTRHDRARGAHRSGRTLRPRRTGRPLIPGRPDQTIRGYWFVGLCTGTTHGQQRKSSYPHCTFH
jgi:hypothetical protein